METSVHGNDVDATCRDSWKTEGMEEIIIYGELETMIENVVMNYSNIMYP